MPTQVHIFSFDEDCSTWSSLYNNIERQDSEIDLVPLAKKSRILMNEAVMKQEQMLDKEGVTKQCLNDHFKCYKCQATFEWYNDFVTHTALFHSKVVNTNKCTGFSSNKSLDAQDLKTQGSVNQVLVDHSMDNQDISSKGLNTSPLNDPLGFDTQTIDMQTVNAQFLDDQSLSTAAMDNQNHDDIYTFDNMETLYIQITNDLAMRNQETSIKSIDTDVNGVQPLQKVYSIMTVDGNPVTRMQTINIKPLATNVKPLATVNIKPQISFHDKSLIYYCSKCDRDYQNLSINMVNQHIAIHGCQSNKIICTMCEENCVQHVQFDNRESLITHIKSHQLFICSHCNAVYTSSGGLQEHIKKKHSVTLPKKCVSNRESTRVPVTNSRSSTDTQHPQVRNKNQLCADKVLVTNQILDEQSINHIDVPKVTLDKPTDGRLFECPECDTISSNSPADHLASHSGETSPFLCAICFEEFEVRSELMLHLVVHTKSVMDCPECNLCFIDNRKFKAHVSSEHKTAYYHCKFCELRFFWLAAYRKHLTTSHPQSQNKKIVCEFCGGEYTKRHLKHHISAVHNKNMVRVQCSICQLSVIDLNHHMKVVHSQQNKKYSCNVCDKKFQNEKGIKNHMETHKVERKHECSWCQKSFKRAYALRTHERIHSGYKPLQCSVCEERFTQGGSLNYHMKSKHPDQYKEQRINLACTKRAFATLLLPRDSSTQTADATPLSPPDTTTQHAQPETTS